MEDQDSILSDLEPSEVESSRPRMGLANFIDMVIEIGLLFGIFYFLPRGTFSRLMDSRPYAIYLIFFVFIFGYRLISFLVFDKTIGMMLCRLKLLNKKLEPLSAKEKLLALLPVNIFRIKYYKVL